MSAAVATRSRLTAVIVVGDAESSLNKSLESVAGLADETLLVDVTGRSATTIAHRPGVQTICGSADDPTAARNQALAQSVGDWSLFLDAGEILHSASATAILDWLANNPTQDTAYLCWIESAPATPDVHGEQVASARLLPKHPGIRFDGLIRETVLPSLETHSFRVEVSDWRILQPAADQDPIRGAARAQQQLRLAALEAKLHGMSPRALVASAEAHTMLGDRARATQHYYQALRLADRGSLDMLIAYYGLLGSFRGDETDRRQQLAVCLEALESFPFDAQLLCAMGAYLQQQDHLELACRSFQAAFEIGQVEPRALHLKDLLAIAAVSWSLISQLRGENDRALSILEQACDRFPLSRNLARRRLELLVQLGREVEALAVAISAADEGTAVESLRIGVRGACLAAQGNWIPALTYLRTAHEAGCNDPICLRWLAVGLMALGQADAARPVLRTWREVAPGDVEATRYEQELEAIGADRQSSKGVRGRTTRVDRPAPLEMPGQLPRVAGGAPIVQPAPSKLGR